LYATKNLPVDDVVKLKECFDIFDYDKGGSISPEELTNSIKALGLEAQAGKILQIVNLHTEA
jgi:centrin-1